MDEKNKNYLRNGHYYDFEWRVSTDNKLISIGIACLMLIAGFAGFIHLSTVNVRGTDVSGTVYDGSGGPWTIAGSPYFVVGDVTIPSGETLTIDPGVEVKFNGSFGIFVDGNLNAIGSETERINITSNLPSPSNSDWDKIHIRSSGHVDIRYSNIRYGYIGLHIESSSNNIILNCNITENGDTLSTGFGIYLQSSSYNNISNNNIWWNTERGIYLSSSSSNNIIKNNNVSHNGNPAMEACGLYLGSSMNNTITDNNVTGNGVTSDGYGIGIVSSSNNTLTNNRVWSNDDEGIRLISSSYNDISNNNISSHNFAGINLQSSSNNTIENNNISDGYYGIFLETSDNNEINDNKFFDIGGIYVSASSNNKILFNDGSDIRLSSSSNNTLSKNNLKSILLEDSSKNNVTYNDVQFGDDYGIRLISSSNNTFLHNNMLDNGRSGVGYGIGLLSSSANNIIRENNIKSNDNYGIYSENSFSNRISNNNITSNGFCGVTLGSSSNTTIENNYVCNNWQGIWLTSSSNDNTVVGNNASSNLGSGIEVSGSSNKIMNNDITLNSNGIEIKSFPSASHFNYIAHNNISSHSSWGIYLDSSTTNSTILNNHLSNNGEGVYIYYSSDNIICHNNILSTANNGFLLASSVNNTITGNTVFNSQLNGIHLNSSSSSNKIYHNNFIDNADQADDFGPGNLWDNGYPSGGNYWSDFDEPGEGAYDDYRGPNQDELPAGGDGIVDKGPPIGGKNPYFIDFVDSQDNYPLITPYERLENYTILKPGWNLISIPLIQEQQNLTRVLKSIDGLYDAVEWYNTTDANDHWTIHKVGKPFGNDLSEINETMGFWIHITQPWDTIFLYNGTTPTQNQNITLHPGWNLVGYPSLSNKNRTEATTAINFGSDVDSIWTFNAATQRWKELGESDYFELCRGYWVHARTECVWEVPL